MRLVSFGSGSSGNAFLLDTGAARILIDCGIGVRRLRQGLAGLGASGMLDAILISHEHVDHVRALQSLLRYERCPVYASNGTFNCIGRQSGWMPIRGGTHLCIAGLDVTPVNVSHDALEPLGFFIETGAEKIALFTDLGEPNLDVHDAIAHATLVILEANYCERMLRQSMYPPYLKQRIRSRFGHLSNDDCAGTLVDALRPSTRAVWLAHLSENNNAPATATETVKGHLSARGIGIPVQPLPRHDTADLLALPTTERSWQTSLCV
jgi:phosphoribosyl 1,2-cyclic phosphodiesterase